jgi:hypothetical protein
MSATTGEIAATVAQAKAVADSAVQIAHETNIPIEQLDGTVAASIAKAIAEQAQATRSIATMSAETAAGSRQIANGVGAVMAPPIGGAALVDLAGTRSDRARLITHLAAVAEAKRPVALQG